MAAHVVAVGGDGSELAGPERDGVGGVGLDGKHLRAEHGGKEQEGTAAGHGIEHAGEKGHDDEVPGIEEKDLDVRVENHTLTVKGERKFEAEEKEQNFHRIERRYGRFYRAFTLPTTVDTENVGASYNAGVLKLELKKKPEAQPKQIKINLGGGAKKEEPELVGAR